jgi:hypothetical protein
MPGVSFVVMTGSRISNDLTIGDAMKGSAALSRPGFSGIQLLQV